jgi:hypothetical protein
MVKWKRVEEVVRPLNVLLYFAEIITLLVVVVET